jgi:hypothetical protein
MSDFSIKQGNLTPRIKQTVTLPAAANLTNATAKFVYSLPGGDRVTKDAVINSTTPSVSAATAVELEYPWTADDVALPGVYRFEWEITLGDSSPLTVPSKAPTLDEPDRVFQTFEVLPTL